MSEVRGDSTKTMVSVPALVDRCDLGHRALEARDVRLPESSTQCGGERRADGIDATERAQSGVDDRGQMEAGRSWGVKWDTASMGMQVERARAATGVGVG